MLDMKDVLEILSPHNDLIGLEGMAALKLALMEKDVEVDTSEIDRLKSELEAEKKGREDEKSAYDAAILDFNTRFDRLIKGKNPEEVTDIVDEVIDTPTVEDDEDLYEALYGGNE